MHRTHALIAGLIASSWLGCAGPIECPGGRIADGEACVCPPDLARGADADCAASRPDSPHADEASDERVPGLRDAGLDLDAALRTADPDGRALAATERHDAGACTADAGCGDAAMPADAALDGG